MKSSRLLPWMLAAGCAVLLVSDATAATMATFAAPTANETQLVASDGAPDDLFGSAVARDGDTLVIGAEQEDLGVGVGLDAGAAYVFERDPGTGEWVETAKVRGADIDVGDDFGSAVSISGDTIAVGAPQHDVHTGGWAGAVYIFERDLGGPSAWGERQELTPPGIGGLFGAAVVVSGDRLFVGAPATLGPGVVYVYERDPVLSLWSQVTSISPVSGQDFGWSIATTGERVLVGAPRTDVNGLVDAGAAFLFARNLGGPGAWGQVAEFTMSTPNDGDRFGSAVGLDVGVAVVGAMWDDHSGMSDAGSATVFELQGGGPTWSETFLASSNLSFGDYFGHSVAVDDGKIAVGASNGASPVSPTRAGIVYLFERGSGGTGPWSETGSFFAEDGGHLDALGETISLEANEVLAGARFDIHGFDVREVEGLATDLTSGTVYGVGDPWDQLVTVDPATGVATPVGTLTDGVGTTFTNVQGLAFDSGTQQLYGSDVDGAQLLAIDPTTATATVIGPLGFSAVRGLAFEATTGKLFGSDDNTDQLILIDPTTGSARLSVRSGSRACGASRSILRPGCSTGPMAVPPRPRSSSPSTSRRAPDLGWSHRGQPDPWTGVGPKFDDVARSGSRRGSARGHRPEHGRREFDRKLLLAPVLGWLCLPLRDRSVERGLLHLRDVGERMPSLDRRRRDPERDRGLGLHAHREQRRGRQGRSVLLRGERAPSEFVGERHELPVRCPTRYASRLVGRYRDERFLRRLVLPGPQRRVGREPEQEPGRRRARASPALAPRSAEHEQSDHGAIGRHRAPSRSLRDSIE